MLLRGCYRGILLVSIKARTDRNSLCTVRVQPWEAFNFLLVEGSTAGRWANGDLAFKKRPISLFSDHSNYRVVDHRAFQQCWGGEEAFSQS